MFLTPRTAWAVAVGALLVVIVPRPLVALCWTAAVLVLALVDVALAPAPSLLELQRTVPRAVRLGEPASSILTIAHSSSRSVQLQVRDAWPPSAGADPHRPRLSVPAGERRRVTTSLHPTRRGDREADLVTVRILGPLGLAGRQHSLFVPARLRVLPEFRSRRHLPSRLARLREIEGRSPVMLRGAGTEFDSLRAYVAGDDVRSIDWRSSARRGEVLVRTWRPERDRRVLLIVDSGRMSAARLGEETRLNSQIETALLISSLAVRAGDRVDIVALDTAARAQVRGRSGPDLMTAVAEALTPVEPSLVDTDWSLVHSTVMSVLSQRALVIVLTGLDGAGANAQMLRVLSQVAHEHVVMVASASDPGAERLRLRRDDSESVYLAAAAERELLDLAAVRLQLRQAGIEVVEAHPAGLPPAVADAYLMLKARGGL